MSDITSKQMKVYKEELTDLLNDKWKVVFYDPRLRNKDTYPQRLKELVNKGYEVALYKFDEEEQNMIFLQESASDFVKEKINGK